MSRNNLCVLLPAALAVLFWAPAARASQRAESHKTEAQAQAARLRRGQFVRIRTASRGEVSGHFRSLEGSRLVLEDRRHQRLITIESGDILRVRSGRGFLGSLRRGFSATARTLAKPVTDTVLAYQKMDAMGDLMR